VNEAKETASNLDSRSIQKAGESLFDCVRSDASSGTKMQFLLAVKEMEKVGVGADLTVKTDSTMLPSGALRVYLPSFEIR
jgi:hypothetical protein